MMNQSPFQNRRKWSSFALPVSLVVAVVVWGVGQYFAMPSWWVYVLNISILIALVFVWHHLWRGSTQEEEILFNDRRVPDTQLRSVPDHHHAVSPRYAQTEGVMSPAHLAELARGGEIRQFASPDDGRAHGWLFEHQIGMYNGYPIYQNARPPNASDKVFIFDGLVGDIRMMLPESVVVFGKMRYIRHATNSSP